MVDMRDQRLSSVNEVQIRARLCIGGLVLNLYSTLGKKAMKTYDNYPTKNLWNRFFVMVNRSGFSWVCKGRRRPSDLEVVSMLDTSLVNDFMQSCPRQKPCLARSHLWSPILGTPYYISNKNLDRSVFLREGAHVFTDR